MGDLHWLMMFATAIIVPVPEAEVVVGRWRRDFTQDGAEGMPPHVTLLYPFVDDEVLVAGHIRELRRVLGGIEPFEFTLDRLARFAGTDSTPEVLFLAPEPADNFVAMTEAVVTAFREYPPYGGRHSSIVPHLTVADKPDSPHVDIRDDVSGALPITVRVAEAWLMRRGHHGWRMWSRIRLGADERDYRNETMFA